MQLNRLKVVAAGLLALCLAGAGPGVWAYRALAAPAEAPRPAAGPPQAREAPAAPRAEGQVPQPDKVKEQPKARGRVTAEEVLTRSFKTGKAPRLAVEVFNGGITVVVGAEGAVEARLTKRSRAGAEEEARQGLENIDVQMTQEKNGVRISARRIRERRESQEEVAAELRVPPGAALDLRTSNGSVRLTGATADVKAETSNGAIRAEGGKGALRLTTRNGAIVVTGATGVVELKTSNGRIDLQAEKAVVKAETSNGAIAFRGSLAGGEHTFSTRNGPITVTLPAGAQFRVDATTSLGAVKSEFAGAPAKPGRRLVATVGEKPTATLKLHTSNGSIEIRKRK